MAWPQPPPLRPSPAPDPATAASPASPQLGTPPGPALASSPPAIPPRPASVDFYSVKNRISQYSALSSPMPLSTSNAKSGVLSTSDRRESAPLASRSSAFSPLSSPITGIMGNDPPRLRPRSNSHIQTPAYSPSVYHRPLPAPPLASAAKVSVEDTIKVPVDDNGAYSSFPSSVIINSNQLHPNSHTQHPYTPQQLPQNSMHASYQGYSSDGSGVTDIGVHPLEILSFKSRFTQEPTRHEYGQKQEHGGSYGQIHEEPLQNERRGSDYHSSTQSAGASRTSSERSLQHHHLSNLLRDNTAKQPKSHAISSSSSKPLAGTSSFTGSVQHPGPRLANRNTSSASSLTPSTMEYNSAASLSSFSSPPLSSQEYPTQYQSSPSDLQPYYPPPPPTAGVVGAGLLQFHQQAHTINGDPSSGTAASTTPASMKSSDNITMTGGKPKTLTPNHSGRRHSSSTRELSIKTQHLNSLRKGPHTADAAGTSSRFLDPDGPVRGSGKNNTLLRPPSPSLPSHIPPRQSPNHLSIPHPAHSTLDQVGQQLQQYRHQHQPPVQPIQHSYYTQLQSQKDSTARSTNHTRPISPSTSHGPLNLLQDRTAMVLMQRYLTCPDDPDSEADIAMQIMISQAAVDSKGFEVIAPQAVASIKRHHATLSSRIAALSARLSLESKIREAAQSLLKLHADNKKLARQARDHLEAANRKVDQVATELWKLTQLAADLQRTLLQHTSGVLALGVVRLEDQGRRERELHAVQIQEARIGQDVKEQFESMAKVIMNLESDTLEAQSLLEDKDRAIERLMKQLEHQRNLFIRLDDQQQKTMALSRSQQKNMDAIENDSNDSKPVAEMTQFLHQVQEQLQRILQQQQQQRVHHTKQPSKELISKLSVQSESQDPSLPPLREDSTSSAPSDGNTTTGTSTASETVVGSKSSTLSGGPSHFSMDGIRSTLDALENHMTESQQKMNVLEGELGLLRRQSVVLSASRNNSIKIKNFSAPRPGMLAEETIRSALEKSLKDALLAKEVAQQELENERQRWQEDQDHRISALEESIVAVEEQDKTAQAGKAIEGNTALSKDEAVQELRRQLQEAIEEIDILNHQQQANLKSLRQLFDLIPDTRRKSHMQLYSSHQQLQQQIVSSPDRNVSSVYGNGVSPAGSTTSLLSVGAVGFSMEALIVRIKELVTRSQQVEQDNADLRQQIGKPAVKSRAETPEEPLQYQQQQQQQQQDDLSTWILKTDLERLQANAEMAQLLETELDMLKQHTDVLLDENARLADLAAASATGSPAPIRLTGFGVALQKPVQDDTFDELQEIIRIKDRLLLERDRLVQEQEEALRQAQVEIEKVKSTNTDGMDGAVSGAEAVVEVSEFDVATMDILRLKCSKLEDETSEMRMIITALESVKAGSGTGSQILRNLSISSNTLSPETSSRSGSPVAPATELYTGGLESSGIGPGSNAAVTIATAALRREFRRAMSELREEKEKAVRKEVEERRRLEKELRHMRRQLHTIHVNAHA